MTRLLLIAVFGLLGVFSRYYLGLWTAKFFGDAAFPYATLAINVLGAFGIGIVYVVALEYSAMSEDWRLAMMIGLLGSFTTFSTYCLETSQLFDKAGHVATGLVYLLLSPILGLAATYGGLVLTRLVLGKSVF